MSVKCRLSLDTRNLLVRQAHTDRHEVKPIGEIGGHLSGEEPAQARYC